MYRILIVCTGNTCRSPMLECFLKDKIKKLNKNMEIKSAGLSVQNGDKVNEKARKAVKKYGLVIRHKPTMLTSKAMERVDSVITMTIDQKRYLMRDKCYYKVFSMGETVGFDIYDPYGGTQEQYDKCAEELNEASEIIVQKLIKAGKI